MLVRDEHNFHDEELSEQVDTLKNKEWIVDDTESQRGDRQIFKPRVTNIPTSHVNGQDFTIKHFEPSVIVESLCYAKYHSTVMNLDLT